MKLSIYSILLAMAMTHGAHATLAVRVVFNQGVIVPSIFCSAGEWDQVEAAMDKGCLAGRRLGETTHSRKLTNCQTVCSSFPPGMCYLSGTGCRNRRRELQEPALDEVLPLAEPEAELPAPSRQLFTESACSSKNNRIAQELAVIQNKVGPVCRVLIMNTPRDFTCYDV
jgi:hypothetical protein